MNTTLPLPGRPAAMPAPAWYRALLFCFAIGLAMFVAGCGGSDSSTASSATAPSILTQPSSASVTEGQSVSFTVTATGTAPLSYQWRRNGSAISGATTLTYSIAAVATGDAGSFDVVISNSAGSVTSSAVTLTVASTTGAPVITTQPSSQSVVVGATITLSVTASGSAPLGYQWSKDGTAVSGATGSTYSIASVATSDAGSYTVAVSNSAGSVTSNAAVLSVTASSSGGSSQLSADATTAAQAFIATLSTTQQSSVQLAWSLDTARHWSNLPAGMVSRNGLSWGSLSTAQKTAARTLIGVALGATGNTLHQGLQAADDALVSLYGANSTYGSGNYYIAFLGTPSTSGFWLLQLTGHHLTYNIAFNGSVKSPTPLFLGVEPKGSFTLSGTTWDPMAAQRMAVSDLGAALVSYPAAALTGTYADLLFGANGSGGIDGTYPKSYPSGTSNRGIAYGSLSSAHQELVKAVVRAYVNTQATEYSNDLLSAYLGDTALASTYVAYAGSGTVTSNGNYFRIDGPRVWIEFSVQRGVIVSSDIHYHTIWRDKAGDYGGRCCAS